ncbi:MAG: nucleoside hydrolase [Anaerolineales bacterium]|nr:nucleoside hydrolase [Anaerolineales bacterium]
MQRLIIDTDPGVDDAHAIMLALRYPDVQVEAILTVSGNVGIDYTTANAQIVLDLMKADVPVYRGCAGPLMHRPGSDASSIHGSDGLGDMWFPPSSRKAEPEPASQALVRLANAEPGEFTLVTLGPLTNIAVALKLDPSLPRKIKELVIMGGAIHADGNTPNLSAEYNIYADPEAAFIVFNAFPAYTLVSWETTVANGISPETMEKWRAFDTPESRFLFQITRKVLKFLEEKLSTMVLYAADVLAMAVALEPTIVEQAEDHALFVELSGEHTRGQTVVDWKNRSGKPASARIVMGVNQNRFQELAGLPLHNQP